MPWVRSSCKRNIVLYRPLSPVRDFLLLIVECGRLMPSVVSLEETSSGVFHYLLEEFSDGAVQFTPDYESRFDVSDPGNIRWQPHGEHDFRSWGTFRTEAGAVDGETILEIETRSETNLAIDPILIPLVEPFANRSSVEVTEGFLAAIKTAVEGGSDTI